MEDFYFLERDDGTEAGGTINGSKFYAWSYGGMYRINIDGVRYPSVAYNADTNQIHYDFENAHTTSDAMKELGGNWPDQIPVPEGDPSAILCARLEALAKTPDDGNEFESDIPTQIAADMDDLGDADEFEDDSISTNKLFHIVNGKKLYVRDVEDIGDKPEEIKKLPTHKTLQEPPLPKGLFRNKS